MKYAVVDRPASAKIRLNAEIPRALLPKCGPSAAPKLLWKEYHPIMIKPLTRLLTVAFFVSLLAPGFIAFTGQLHARQTDGTSVASVALLAALSIGVAGTLALVFYGLMKKAGPFLEAGALRQGDFLRALNPRYVDLAIF